MSDLRFDHQMTEAEGLMWRLEKDPFLSSTFGSVFVLDRAPDFEMFKRRLERAAVAIPRLRQRVSPTPANLAPPVWVDDPNFDIDFHVRRVACPQPGMLRQVLDLASTIVADPLDRTRPLWQFVVVEGMKGGKAAVIQKMHHTLTDGERGVQLSIEYIDFERDAPQPPPLNVENSDDENRDDSDGSVDDNADDGGSGDPGSLYTPDMIKQFLAGSIRLPLGVTRQVLELMKDPTSIPAAAETANRTLRGILSQLTDTESAHSPLWTQRSLHRVVEVARAPFAETKESARRLGGTLNTAFMTAAAHAASEYHLEFDAPVETLRSSMVVSTRTQDSGSNAIALVRLDVPTAEMPIVDRFHAIHELTQTATEARRGGGLDALATVVSVLPTSMITHIARQQSQTIDFATSNVKGSPYPIYLAGARITEVYPIGPLGGVAFNLTLMSHNGSLDMGINVDTAAVEYPELLAEKVQFAFRALNAAHP